MVTKILVKYANNDWHITYIKKKLDRKKKWNEENRKFVYPYFKTIDKDNSGAIEYEEF